MIHALHGMIGDPTDWDFLRGSLPLPVTAHPLWQQVDHFVPWARKFCTSVARHPDPPVLLGYSMGGRLALHALVEQPTLWRAAIVVSAHSGLTDREARRARWSQDNEWAMRVRSLPWQTFLQIWNEQGVLAGSPVPGNRMPMWQWRQAIVQAFDCWGLGRQQDLLPKLAPITVPTLWITGERDEKFDAVGSRAVAAMPAARHLRIPGAGHRLPWEKPDAFLTAVREFLAELGSPPPPAAD